jgi:hypothetical protein
MSTEILAPKMETEPAEACGKMDLPSAYTTFLPDILFDPEDGSVMFLYNGFLQTACHYN